MKTLRIEIAIPDEKAANLRALGVFLPCISDVESDGQEDESAICLLYLDGGDGCQRLEHKGIISAGWVENKGTLESGIDIKRE